MTERIKLTKDSFESITFDYGCSWVHSSDICLNTGDEEEDKKLKQQILENQEFREKFINDEKEYANFLQLDFDSIKEKAEKYDSLMKANNEILKNNISHTQIQQENKQLKEIEKRYNLRLHRITTLEKHNKELVDELAESLQKLEKQIELRHDLEEAMDYEPDLVERLELTKKLEKIEEYCKKWHIHDDELNEILASK